MRQRGAYCSLLPCSSRLYEPLSPAEVERAQQSEDSHGRLFSYRHRASGRDCAVRFLSVEKLVSTWKGSSEAAATALMDKPERRAYDIMARWDGRARTHHLLQGRVLPAVACPEARRLTGLRGCGGCIRAVTVLDGLRHPNLLGLADPMLYVDPIVAASSSSSPSPDEAASELLLKVVTEAGERVQQEDGVDVESTRELLVDLTRGLHCLHANLYLHRSARQQAGRQA